ncbi:MAG: RNA methyltransferase [Bacteroidaceae bacterium]|nr:RNA methyltransferase [Bacteroidaceae bacterium]
MITSTQNPRIKHLLLLQQKSSLRREEGLFVVEGRREVEHCLAAGFRIRTAFVCEEISPLPAPPLGECYIPVSPNVYERIAYRGGTEGIVAEVEARQIRLADLRLSASPLIVVLESVEKPGNLGAVLRSADAAGADAVVVCDPLTDLFNPNLIRSSIGAAFTVPCVACTSDECIAFFRERGIRILTAQLQDSRLYYDTPMTGPTAIVMGTEATGLTDQWRRAADAHIRIPMLGRLDSLNVSVSAAILLFEAVRQRQIQ